MKTKISIMLLLPALLFTAGCKNDTDNEGPEPPAASFQLVYSTYWGGEPQANKGIAIAVDKEGNIYVAGETQSPSFYVQNPVIDGASTTSGFVSKFAPDGQSLIFSTVLGARDGYNWCLDLVADDLGNAIVGGLAGGPTFPLRHPLYPTFSEPWQCGFLSSIAAEGSNLNFSTFILPGRVAALALDADRNIYLAAWNRTVLKISADGRRLIYEYKIPGVTGNTLIEDIAVAPGGALIMAGWTSDPAFPSLNPIAGAKGKRCDAFILKLNPAGSALEFATRLGGAEDDFALGVALGADGTIHACGSTASSDFPLTHPAATAYNGYDDAFAARIDPLNGTLLYSTRLGGVGDDRATGMALNAAGEAYLCGWTASPDFPVRGPFQIRLGGVKDAFVCKLSAGGDKIMLSTFFGGVSSFPYGCVPESEFGADWCNDICLGPEGKIYITGETYAKDLPLLDPLDDHSICSKAFLAVFREKQP